MFDSALHLFVDDHHVRTIFGLRREFGKLEKHPEPVLEDIPGRLACWACVLREPDGLYRMWYQSVHAGGSHELGKAGVWGRGEEFGYFPERHPNPIPRTQTSVISYAESDDGIHWRKPELGLIEHRGSRANNIVLDGAAAAKHYDNTLTNMDTVSVVRDEADPDPAKRYKMVCHWEGHVWANHPTLENLGRSEAHMQKVWASRAKYMNTSPDGIRWEQVPVRIKDCAGGGDYAAIARDERNQRWWFTDRAPVGLNGVGYRSAGVCVSDDLYHWPDTVEMVFTPGAFEEYGLKYEHHGWTPFNYGDMDLCLLEYSIGGWPIAGVLGMHRDGEPWRKVNGDAFFLELGPGGTFDDSIVAMTHNAPWRDGDRLLFHYNGRHRTDQEFSHAANHTAHIGVATLRLDGFAALCADQAFLEKTGKPAMLITRPLEVRENELQLNIAGHGGTARVALLDANMKPIPGFEAENCLPVAEDAVRAPVRWQAGGSLAELRGRRVHLYLEMNRGRLYAVRV
jgi:hypothetical protein